MVYYSVSDPYLLNLDVGSSIFFIRSQPVAEFGSKSDPDPEHDFFVKIKSKKCSIVTMFWTIYPHVFVYKSLQGTFRLFNHDLTSFFLALDPDPLSDLDSLTQLNTDSFRIRNTASPSV